MGWSCSDALIVNFEQIPHDTQHIDLVFLFLTLNMHLFAGYP